MTIISNVIKRLETLRDLHGDLEVLIVNYHSDYSDCPIENIDDAIALEPPGKRPNPGGRKISPDRPYIRIGGETY
jgi:hypothetical protein